MGIRLVFGSPFATVRRVGTTLEVSMATGQTFRPEKVLFARDAPETPKAWASRRPGLRSGESGDIVVDGQYETTAAGIYAAGDVIGPPRSLPCRWSRLASRSATPSTSSSRTWWTSWPPTACIRSPRSRWSASPRRRRGRRIDYEIGSCPFSANAKAPASPVHEGMVKLVFRRATGCCWACTSSANGGGAHPSGSVRAHQQAPIDYFIHATFNVPT